MRYTTILLLILNFGNNQAHSQTETELFFKEKIPTKLLLADIDTLISLHKKYDPSYYYFTSETKIDSIVWHMKSKINEPKNRIEFKRIVKPYIVSIGERHNAIYYSNRSYNDYYYSTVGRVLPFKIYYLKGKYYIHQSKDKEEIIPNGSELKKVNGNSIHVIDSIFRQSFLRDGTIEPPIAYTINNNRFWDNYISWVHQESIIDTTMSISYMLPNANSVITKKVTGQKVRKVQVREKPLKPFEYRLLTDSIAYIKIDDFDDRIKWKTRHFLKFYKKSFSALADDKIPYLILDIRNNTGGNSDLPVELAKYFINEEEFVLNSKTVISQKKIKWNNRKVINIGDGFKKGSNGEWYMEEELVKNDKIQSFFKGKLILLINEDSYSATTWLASFIKENNLGVIVGRETTGHCGGSTSSYGNIFSLPNSKLQHHIGYMRTEYPHKNQSFGRGVIPDIIVEYSFEEVIEKKDVILDSAISFIKKAIANKN